MRPRLLKLALVAGVFFGISGTAYAAVVACWGLSFATSATSHTDLKSVAAGCPSGWKVTGGGGDIDGGEPEAFLRGTKPTSAFSWGASGHEVDPSPTAWNVEARAVCATLPLSAGHQLVSASTSSEIAPGVKFAVAGCPAGKKAIGGGAQINGATMDVLLRTTRPTAAGTGWEAAATTADGSAAPWSLEVWAVCVNTGIFPDSQVVTAVTASDTSSQKVLPLTCPGGKRPLGGGADIGGGSPNQAASNWDEGLVTTAPTFDLSRRWVAAAQVEDAHTTPWSLQVYVVCATAPY